MAEVSAGYLALAGLLESQRTYREIFLHLSVHTLGTFSKCLEVVASVHSFPIVLPAPL